jgi:hypothetical protein
MRSIVNVLLAAACVVYAPASLAQSPLIAMRKASSDLTTSYLQAWSAPQAASPAYVARVYAPRVSFYGRTFDRGGLVREKRRFVRRWPVRQYALRPGSARVTCNQRSKSCLVASTLDWRTENPARRLTSRGSSSFEQRLDFSADRPAIVHESGRVLPRS